MYILYFINTKSGFLMCTQNTFSNHNVNAPNSDNGNFHLYSFYVLIINGIEKKQNTKYCKNARKSEMKNVLIRRVKSLYDHKKNHVRRDDDDVKMMCY